MHMMANRIGYWAERIAAAWRETLEGILSVGRMLVEAKAEVGHGDFEVLMENLPFSPRTAERLMRIAHNPQLANPTHVSVLPPSWGTLYELTKLDGNEFDELLEAGVIRPDLERAEIAKYLRRERVREDEARIMSLKPAEGRFRTLIFDPAWDYQALSLAGRAAPDYALQGYEALIALDVQRWVEAQGCHLYLWVTNNFLGRGCELVSAWGFQHRTVLTWIKPPPFGLGSYFRNSTEHVLFATCGETTTRPAAAALPTHFEAPRGEHSEKPERFYEIVRAASYPPYGEGNQRAARPDFAPLFESVRHERVRA